MNWVKEDNIVMELKKWLGESMMMNMRKVRTIEEKVREFETGDSQQVWERAVGESGGWDLLSGGQI